MVEKAVALREVRGLSIEETSVTSKFVFGFGCRLDAQWADKTISADLD